MNLRDIKALLNTLSEEEFNGELLYNSHQFSISGVIEKIEKSKEDLYSLEDDDPASLYTKKQLINDYGMDKEEIEECEIEIPKGSICISF